MSEEYYIHRTNSDGDMFCFRCAVHEANDGKFIEEIIESFPPHMNCTKCGVGI